MAAGARPNARSVEQYEHGGQTRANNPPVGLVTPGTDPLEVTKKTYAYDPHLDPQLVWAGKAEHTSFEVPTVSLHVHERIDPRTIIDAARKTGSTPPEQLSFFATPAENPPLRQAVEFYQHAHGWTNRLIAGDSLLVMSSLLEKEGLGRRAQMAYVDPPYGIRYGSNFQPFVNRRDVKDGKDEDLTSEPEMIRAFRDTWELGVHSYLAYLRDRLLLIRELLHESGSVFVQIGDENVHLVRSVLDEVFGAKNFVSLITVLKTTSATSVYLGGVADFIVWYAKDLQHTKYRKLFRPKTRGGAGAEHYGMVELPDGTRRPLTEQERRDPATLPARTRLFTAGDLQSASMGRDKGLGAACWFPVEFEGKTYLPNAKNRWKTNEEGMARLLAARRVLGQRNALRYVRYVDDFPAFPLHNVWTDVGGATGKIYVVQTNPMLVQRCVLMTTDPGDLVLDPTCGAGTTASVAEQWGRRWITCDTSRVAITLAKQRLMTAAYDFYELTRPEEGVSAGFVYRTVPHVTLRSIATGEPSVQELLFDQPRVDASKARISGPFTVEAVPAPVVRPLVELEPVPTADASLGRSGETIRQEEWRDELLRTGIRGRGGQRIQFSRVEPLAGTRWLHAEADTVPDEPGAPAAGASGLGVPERPQTAVISFGPEHAPLEQRQLALAIEEAQSLVPRPQLLVFAAFQFDPEAAKDIDETRWPGVTLLKAQMNADLLTEDLKKKRTSDDSFWLMGQPEVTVRYIAAGSDTGKYQVEVHGFDYYDTRTGAIESGGARQIAMWLLDPDYDGRSLFPRQVFFPMAGADDGWARLAKTLRAEVDETQLEAYRGTISLPFAPGGFRRVAVKIVDDRGIESLKIERID